MNRRGVVHEGVSRRELKMLVLSRKEGERISIGDNITITVVRIMHNAVRLGIEAHEGATIVRKELMVPTERVDAPEAPPRGLNF